MKKSIIYWIFQLTLLLLICTRCSRGTQINSDTDFDQTEDLDLIEVPDSISSLEQRGLISGTYNGQNTSHSSSDSKAQKCSKQSILLARQALMHELELINNYNTFWFNDLDKDELVEEQKHSLGNIIMSSKSQQLLNDNGQPLFEIESSYFRPLSLNQLTIAMLSNSSSQQYSAAINNLQRQQQQQQLLREHQQYSTHTTSTNLAVSIKLTRRKDRCYLSGDKSHYIYNVGVSVGPIEHNLDVVYNLPKELRLSQPIDWRYAHIKLIVPKMNYEVTLRQVANYKLINKVNDEHQKACPQELLDVTYLNSRINEVEANSASNTTNSLSTNYKFAIIANGFPKNNQTLMHLERLFNDYTRPTISKRLRQVLKFYLNSKTLPLSTS